MTTNAPTASPPMESEDAYEIELDVFEGPLDLLLHLVRRHELDILDIPIAFVCRKYLEYLAFMQALDIEVAGDYLVMAATLAWLKSRELLPRPGTEDDEEDEVAEDPRARLVEQLLEYRTFKDAAERMDALPIEGRDVFFRGGAVELPPVDPGLAPITLFRLAEAFHRVLEKARIQKKHEVVLERITVRERMRQLALMLVEAPSLTFESLFLGRTWNSEQELRSMLVVTLMSILEMVKIGLLSVHQPAESENLWIERKVEADALPVAVASISSVMDEDGDGARLPPPDEIGDVEGDRPTEMVPATGDGDGAGEAGRPGASHRSEDALKEPARGSGHEHDDDASRQG